MNYSIDDLFLAVNKIFERYDEGMITLTEANRLCRLNCKSFLDAHPERENLRIEIDDISHINE